MCSIIILFFFYFLFIFYSVISFIIRYTPIIIVVIITKVINFIFLFFNSLKMGLKVVKKNPISTANKNLGNLFKLFQKLYIIILLYY